MDVIDRAGVEHETTGTISGFYTLVLANTFYSGIKASYGKITRMDVVVSMPDLVARQWGDTPQAIGRHVIEDAVIERYRAGRLSHRQVGEALGLDYWRTEGFLKERGVPLNYSASDLEADAATLEKILPRS